ncbi:MAG: hypothetical protein IAF38_10660 [Bacteroidia bacterium]|nr:hypothetical protein [Bacteroidia bacterium]
MRKFSALILLFSILFLASCGGDRLNVDVSEIKTDQVKIKRLENDLFALDTNKIEALSPALQKKYGSFFEKYLTDVLNNGGIADSTYGAGLRRFLGDRDMNEEYKRINEVFTEPDQVALENELTEAFRHIKYYFPDTVLPVQVLTMMSGFNGFGIVNIDSTLAICMDRYLGQDAVQYDMIRVEAYRRRIMDKKYILADIVTAWVMSKFDKNVPDKNLLEVMIKAGKIMYCAKAIIPETQDSLIIGYSQQQITYCEKWEKDLWAHFSQKDKLFTNDLKEIVSYTTDGPFCSAISKDCPPAIAKYIGYRIVCSYMKNNSKVTLQDLMSENDAQKILTKAKYKP